ncbi:response regulator [Ramlibacter sp.]|uniref:response regulator n=1 Tax=Ramlibacter sp. TaxID=1917967 RepID=UPI002BF72D30|nr:response regulator [Ramlibacter sp.]HWI82443.1 response regulator [Ramlibacter sp.]
MNLRPPAPILLVDDAPANLLALEAVLQTLDEPLVRAGSGQEALRRLRDADYAAVLLDVRMPGMDGFETARLIRAQRRSRRTPIIFVTADASDLSVEEAYSMGAVDFLTKPIVPAVLKAKLAFFVELHRSRQELQAAERKAVQDRAFLSAVLEAVEDGIVACGPDGGLTLFNRATREFHAMDSEPVSAANWAQQYDLYGPDGRTPLRPEEVPLHRALAGEVVRNVEMVIAPPGGKLRHLLASGQPLYDEAGHKLGAVVSMHDVSAQREAEQAREAAIAEQTRREEAEAAAELIRESRERLRESEQRVRLATEAAGLGVWVWEPDSDHLTWENDRLFEIFGLARSEADAETQLLRERLSQLAHPDDAAACVAAMAATARTGERLHYEGRFRRCNDGALIWVELTGILQPASAAHPARVLGTAADITQRKHAEDELRHGEERYRTLFDSMDEGFAIIEMIRDPQGRPVDYRFVEINPAFEKHTGMHGAGGRRMREFAPQHEQHWFDIYGRVAATGEPVRFENEAKALQRWFDVYAMRSGGPGSDRVALFFSDITDRRRSGENLRRLAEELAESDRRKTEFLATLAHELRNPLAPISNGLQLLRVGGDSEAKERARGMMERQLRHLVRLVDDLLDIARISSGKVELKKERATLDAVLASAVEGSMPLITAAGHTLDVRIEAPGLQVLADTTRLAQVVSNLLNNAAKYTPDGGRIELVARQDGPEVLVSVKDTGIGIAPEALTEVFEMFTQVGRHRERSQGGLGSGLALVRRLVELHGGSVTAQSPGVGQGSTFTVRLPLLEEGAVTAPSAAAPAASESAPVFRILVVDDNVDAAESLAALLELDGHETRVAHDGDEAIASASEFRPEIMFLDIGMPGKDGYDVARELRSDPRHRDTVLVALTGWGAQDDRARTKSAGFDHHLTKPAELPAVEALLARMAQRRQAVSAA